jgi:hypothetical protein
MSLLIQMKYVMKIAKMIWNMHGQIAMDIFMYTIQQSDTSTKRDNI